MRSAMCANNEGDSKYPLNKTEWLTLAVLTALCCAWFAGSVLALYAMPQALL